jgi:hypothetical protein
VRSASVQSRLAAAGRIRSLSRQLYGALKFDGPAPIDEELKDIIAAHLLEKHS